MKEQDAKVFTSKMYKKGGKLVRETDEVETVFVARIPDEAAYVTLSRSLKSTINMGNFNSAGIEVFFSVPCPQDDEQIELAYEYLTNFVEGKMKLAIEDLK